MSSCSQYMEIDSSYRERNTYSNPGNFNVNFEGDMNRSTKIRYCRTFK